MERQSKGPRGLEPYCKGGQGPPQAVAPPKKKKKKIPVTDLCLSDQLFPNVYEERSVFKDTVFLDVTLCSMVKF